MRYIFTMLWLLLISSSVWAADENQYFDRMLEGFSNSNGFTCQFIQTIDYADDSSQQYRGELAIRQPNMFRWQYHQPYEQLYVSAGKGIWHYEEELMQAEWLAQLESVDPVVMRLLNGRIDHEEIDRLTVQHNGEDGVIVYNVRLKKGPELWMAIEKHSSELLWIESHDTLGNKNRMRFEQLEKRTPEPALFQFTPPEGVDVIGIGIPGEIKQ
ncbi:MAG: outer membrane lipoprotein chaperone LolA [Zetaproteobacteria bacterium]|nr:outer membrane lipoprotein chaperone LolA [Zetaproteobacteria bacterium]